MLFNKLFSGCYVKATLVKASLAKDTVVIAVLLCGLISPLTLALPDDNQQPILISSDSAVKDDKQGLTIYQGKVDIKQGSLNIKADKVTIYSNEEEVTKIIAVGRPASFKQQPQIDKGDVTARANTIEYRVSQKQITLSEAASIDQDGSSITGETINYDIQAARIEAEGQVSGQTNGSGRVQVVIPAPKAAPPAKAE